MIRALRDGDDPATKVAELCASKLNEELGLEAKTTSLAKNVGRFEMCSEKPYISLLELRRVWVEVASAYSTGGDDTIRLDPEDDSIVEDALWILQTQGEIFSSGGLSTFTNAAPAYYTAPRGTLVLASVSHSDARP